MSHGLYPAGGGDERVGPVPSADASQPDSSEHVVRVMYRLDDDGNIVHAFGKNGKLAYLERYRSGDVRFYGQISHTLASGIYGQRTSREVIGPAYAVSALEEQLSVPRGGLQGLINEQRAERAREEQLSEDGLQEEVDTRPRTGFGWDALSIKASMRIYHDRTPDEQTRRALWTAGWGYVEFKAPVVSEKAA